MNDFTFVYIFKHRKDNDYIKYTWTLSEIQNRIGEHKQHVNEIISSLGKDGYKLYDIKLQDTDILQTITNSKLVVEAYQDDYDLNLLYDDIKNLNKSLVKSVKYFDI